MHGHDALDVGRDAQAWTLGINYWPRTSAMYWWKRFDLGVVRDEFAQIASWGLRLVRICLLWEDFQPEPDRIESAALFNLTRVLDAAREHGLQVMVTLFVGNMSGAMWFPRWAFGEPDSGIARMQICDGRQVNRAIRDLYADPWLLRAQVRLATAVADAAASHPALWGYDLANEIDAARTPATADAGWLWAALLAATLHDRDPRHPVTYGAHSPSIDGGDDQLRIDDLAPHLDVLSMHGYPLYSDVAAGPLDPEFVPYVTALTAALGAKPAWMQEFGLCTAAPGEPSNTIQDDFLGAPKAQFLASEEDAAAYYDAVLGRLRAQGTPGVLAWCYADYAHDLWQLPPLDRAIRERSFGLVRADGSEKPAVAVLRRYATQPLPAGQSPTDVLGDLSPTAYYADARRNFARLYERWRSMHGA